VEAAGQSHGVEAERFPVQLRQVATTLRRLWEKNRPTASVSAVAEGEGASTASKTDADSPSSKC